MPGRDDIARALMKETDPSLGDLFGMDFVRPVPIMPNSGVPGAQSLGVGGGTAAPPPPGIKAYHASPHSFDKFDISKVGTGEGAQMYGHGMYAAESPAVSGRGGTYDRQFTARKMGKTDTTPFEEAVLREMGTDPSISDSEILHRVMTKGFGWKSADGLPDFDGMEAALKNTRQNASHIYEVNINANPEHFLDWDKPLSEQSQQVRDALAKVGIQYDSQGGKAHADALYDALVNDGPTTLPKQPPNPSGAQIYESSKLLPGDYRNPPAASQALQQSGIPGIKYLDQGSRGAGEGTRNFVVFDPGIIDVIKKYGIAGALGAGLISEQEAQLAQQQGLGQGGGDDDNNRDRLARATMGF